MNENANFKEYEFNKPLIQKMDSIIDDSIRDCHKKYFHTFDHICVYDIKLTNITNNERIYLKTCDKSMNLYEIHKKLTVAREKGFIFNQINNSKIKTYSNLSNINIRYHLKLGLPPLYCHFFKKISQNLQYIQTHCKNLNNPFHFACRQWYLYNNPQFLI